MRDTHIRLQKATTNKNEMKLCKKVNFGREGIRFIDSHLLLKQVKYQILYREMGNDCEQKKIEIVKFINVNNYKKKKKNFTKKSHTHTLTHS